MRQIMIAAMLLLGFCQIEAQNINLKIHRGTKKEAFFFVISTKISTFKC